MDPGRKLQRKKNGQTTDANTTTDGRPMGQTYIVRSANNSTSEDCAYEEQAEETDAVETSLFEALDLKENDYYEWGKGLAIIINNENFEGNYQKREGTNCDERTMTLALEKYNFKVEVVKDGTLDKIKEALNTVREDTSYDCIVVVVLSHGDRGDKLQAYDREYSKETFWQMLNGKSCPHLIGKPKVVIIQACRGNEASAATQRIQTDSRPIPKSEITLPVEADILTAYSTYEGHSAFRDSLKGTWYIQALSSEIIKHGDMYDFITLLTRANRKVAHQENEDQEKGVIQKQMPVIQSTFTKVFYLTGQKPGLEQETVISLLQISHDKLDMLISYADKSKSSSTTSTFTKPGIRWNCLKVTPTVTKNNFLPDGAAIIKIAQHLKTFLQDTTVVPKLKSDVAAYGLLLVNHMYYWECMEKNERYTIYNWLIQFITTHAKVWNQYKKFNEFQLEKKTVTDRKISQKRPS